MGQNDPFRHFTINTIIYSESSFRLELIILSTNFQEAVLYATEGSTHCVYDRGHKAMHWALVSLYSIPFSTDNLKHLLIKVLRAFIEGASKTILSACAI